MSKRYFFTFVFTILVSINLSCKPDRCPDEMVEMRMDSKSFCIDRYENYIVAYDKDGKPYRYQPKVEYVIKKDGKYVPGNYFNKSDLKDRIYARSSKGMMPVDNVSWIEAEIACKNSGKRLCTEKEWEFACRGGKKQNYPYGDEYREDICNGFEYGNKHGYIGVRPAGYVETCDNGSGVKDLSGNLWEWVDGTDGSKTLKLVTGGGFGNSGYDEEMMSCSKKRYQPPEIRLDGVGFRCCRDK